MTLGPVSAWLVWAVLALACCGLWAVLWTVSGAVRGLRDWWRDRGAPEPFDEDDFAEVGEPELLHEWHDHAPLGYDDEAVRGCPSCEARWELPPERSWEQMTSHQLPLAAGAADHFLRPPGYLAAERERRAPWWEAEHRAAYQALGLDYPSGLLARVREAGR